MIEKSQLENLSEDNLKQIEKWISEVRAANKKKALDGLAEDLLKSGFTKAELVKALGGGGGGGKPKYRNPANKAETWTGRGRRPKWVTEQIAAGRTLEQMTI